MNLDVLGLTLHEGALLTISAAPGNELWASLGRREVVLCQLFASAYPTRPIRHISSSIWPVLACSGANPGSFLLNLELKIAPAVLDYIAHIPVFCLIGLYSEAGCGQATLLAKLPFGALYRDLPSVEQLTEPLLYLTASKSPRLALSLSYDNLGQTGNLLEVRL
jgi:hypothetical protein